MKGGPKPVRVKWLARAKGVTCHHHPCYPAQSCLSLYLHHRHCTTFWHHWKPAGLYLNFHFLLLMSLLTASALLTVSHVPVLLSLHRCVWLSQMFLGLTALAVRPKAEPLKQLLCHLDFEMNQVKKACRVHCSAAEGSWSWAGTMVCCHCWSDSKQGLV